MRFLSALLLAAFAGCAVEPGPPDAGLVLDPFAPPLQPSDCQPASAEPGATLAAGRDTLSIPQSDASIPQVFGPQGGSHLWLGVRTRGLGPQVDLKFEARDAFSGARLGLGSADDVTQGRGPDDACEFRGVALFLNERFPGGAGLADVKVTVSDDSGQEATDVRRVWIGTPLPECVPDETKDPSVIPLVVPSLATRREEAPELLDETSLRPTSGDDALLAAALTGFAASATTLEVELFVETEAGRERVAEASGSPPENDAYEVPALRRGASGCVAPVTVRLPLDPSLDGRSLVLSVTADDGARRHTTERTVTVGSGF